MSRCERSPLCFGGSYRALAYPPIKVQALAGGRHPSKSVMFPQCQVPARTRSNQNSRTLLGAVDTDTSPLESLALSNGDEDVKALWPWQLHTW